MEFPYGSSVIPLDLPLNRCDEITYLQDPLTPASKDLINEALDNPLGSMRLEQLAEGKRSAVILISDGSRLCPSYLFLEQLIHRLNDGGIPDQQITIIVALGAHRKLTREERKRLTGNAVFERVNVLNHSALPEDCIYVGTTSRGTPIEINRHAVKADLLIATGNIEPHRLVGMSGGVKALMPGVASTRTIERHHALSAQHQVQLGDIRNPLHQDLEEAQAFVPVHYLLNTVVNHRRQLLGVVSGSVSEAHRAGIELSKRHFFVPVRKQYDVVIASPGGEPKDLQLYQTIKTMQNAADITKPGGSIICLAQCREGFGNGIWQYWTETIQDREVMMQKLQQQFVLGAHKVQQVHALTSKHHVYLYSEIPASIVTLIGFTPIVSLQATIDRLLDDEHLQIAVMPYAAVTFPIVHLITQEGPAYELERMDD